MHEPESSQSALKGPRESLGRAVVTFISLFRLPYTPGINALSFVCYASYITLRGLWLGPMMIERHGFSLVQSGTVALAVSLVSLLSPSVFGRLDPGVGKRRRWLIGCTLISATLFAVLALFGHAVADIALTLGIGMLSGYMVLQYVQVRSAFPERHRRTCARTVHDVDVPRRRGDAVVHRPDRIDSQVARRRDLCAGALDDFRSTGHRCIGIRVAAASAGRRNDKSHPTECLSPLCGPAVAFKYRQLARIFRYRRGSRSHKLADHAGLVDLVHDRHTGMFVRPAEEAAGANLIPVRLDVAKVERQAGEAAQADEHERRVHAGEQVLIAEPAPAFAGNLVNLAAPRDEDRPVLARMRPRREPA